MVKSIPYKLHQLREELEKTDQGILQMLHQRDILIEHIAETKQVHHMKVVQRKYRKAALNRRLSEGEKLQLKPVLIKKIFGLLHHHSLKKQKQLRHDS